MKIGIPKDGRFGDFGGKYIPETLAPAIEELEKNYLKILCSNFFQSFVQGNLQLLEKKLWRQLFLLLILTKNQI